MWPDTVMPAETDARATVLGILASGLRPRKAKVKGTLAFFEGGEGAAGGCVRSLSRNSPSDPFGP